MNEDQSNARSFEVLIVTGPSGSGKRSRIRILEDLYHFITIAKVEPSEMLSIIKALQEGGSEFRVKKIAFYLAMDSSNVEDLAEKAERFNQDYIDSLKKLSKIDPEYRVLFLYCSQAELERRLSPGIHPLKSICGSLRAAIFKNCEILIELFRLLTSDPDLKDRLIFVDTTNTKLTEQAEELDYRLSSIALEKPHALAQKFSSFGWNNMHSTLGRIDAIRGAHYKSRRENKERLNCLILGESGTGKEWAADVIHHSYSQEKDPFQKIECTAIPETLIESELFGYEPGAFTGASKKGSKGLIAGAAGGSIFLDEVGLINKHAQAKLLRFVEKKEIRKVGSDSWRKIEDCCIFAATSRNLKDEVEHGNFLLDLYYRLAGFTLMIPPLRERREDILLLLDKFQREYFPGKRFSKEAQAILFDYDWPGNIRELKQVLERCGGTVKGQEITIENLPSRITSKYEGLFEYKRHLKERRNRGISRWEVDEINIYRKNLKNRLESKELDNDIADIKKGRIIAALQKHKGNVSEAAKLLGMKRNTLYSEMKELGVKPVDYR